MKMIVSTKPEVKFLTDWTDRFSAGSSTPLRIALQPERHEEPFRESVVDKPSML